MDGEDRRMACWKRNSAGSLVSERVEEEKNARRKRSCRLKLGVFLEDQTELDFTYMKKCDTIRSFSFKDLTISFSI